MRHLGWDRLDLPGGEDSLGSVLGQRQGDLAFVDCQEAPGARADAMSPEESGRKAVLVEWTEPAYRGESLGKLGALAQRTIDRRTEMLCPPGFGQHPRTWPQGRLVADVLIVQTGQFGDPIPLVVSVKTDNGPPHGAPRLILTQHRPSSGSSSAEAVRAPTSASRHPTIARFMLQSTPRLRRVAEGVMSGTHDRAADPASPTSKFDEGGDSACWAHLVCPQCGLINAAAHPVRCERCRATFPVLE
jgi:hypothetical protein